MKTIFWSLKPSFFWALLVVIALGACKKSKVAPEPEPVTPSSGGNTKQTATTNRTFLTNDSLFLYAKEVYFWNDVLPAYDDFEPRKYGSDLDAELFEITRYKKDPATGLPYEYRTDNPGSPKYSYIKDVDNQNPSAGIAAVPNEYSEVDLEGNGNDIGIFAVSALTVSTGTYRLYVLAIDKGSPADGLGLTRGAYITKINSTAIGNSANFQNIDRPLINSTIYGDPGQLYLEGVKTDGTVFKGTLLKKSYKSNPIFSTNVLTVGAKKIGYLAYARFSNEENSFEVLRNAFVDYVNQGVTDMVVDLRYNGGGYINTAEYLVNLISPSTAKGVMYKEYYNTTLQTKKATIMKNQPLLDAANKIRYRDGRMLNCFDDLDYSVAGNTYSFKKEGTLNGVKNVVFIVSGNTASASELVINSLKPITTVTLVGEKTYGKPIGFFPIRIQNKYDVLYSMFETRNSLDQGGYYSGMTPDVKVSTDFGEFDFGNPSEPLLKAAIDVLVPKVPASAVVSRNKLMSISSVGATAVKTNLGKFEQNKEFVGMIENRHQIKQ